jgi:hypothetical protein
MCALLCQQLLDLRDRPCQAAVDADGADRAILQTSPATQGLRLTVEVEGRCIRGDNGASFGGKRREESRRRLSGRVSCGYSGLMDILRNRVLLMRIKVSSPSSISQLAAILNGPERSLTAPSARSPFLVAAEGGEQ